MKKKLLWIGLFLIILLGIGAAIYFFFNLKEEPKKIVFEPKYTSSIVETSESLLQESDPDTPVVVFSERLELEIPPLYREEAYTHQTQKYRERQSKVKRWLKKGNQPAELLPDLTDENSFVNLMEFSPKNNSFVFTVATYRNSYSNYNYKISNEIKLLDLSTKQIKTLFTLNDVDIPGDFKFSEDESRIFVLGYNEGLKSIYEYDFKNSQVGVLFDRTPDADAWGGDFYIEKKPRDDIIFIMESFGAGGVRWFFNIRSKTLQRIKGGATLFEELSKTGKYFLFATKETDANCADIFGKAATKYRITNPVTGAQIFEFGRGDRQIEIMGFSPDDNEVLYRTFAPIIDGSCAGDIDIDEVFKPLYYRVIIDRKDIITENEPKRVLQAWNTPSTQVGPGFESKKIDGKQAIVRGGKVLLTSKNPLYILGQYFE